MEDVSFKSFIVNLSPYSKGTLLTSTFTTFDVDNNLIDAENSLHQLLR